MHACAHDTAQCYCVIRVIPLFGLTVYSKEFIKPSKPSPAHLWFEVSVHDSILMHEANS